MINLSVCMIVKNEEEVLARALKCVQSIADEIIVVDTGSTDNTQKIALDFGAKVYDFEWCDDFSKARNFSFSKATGDYILWLDADDVIPINEQEKILTLKSRLGENFSPNVIMCHYVVETDEQERPTFYYFRERIVKNGIGLTWSEPIHECITPFGHIERLDIKIFHKKIHPSTPKRNLNIYRKMEREKLPFSPRALYYYGRELHYNGIYKKSISILNKFLNSDGWVENKIDACSILAQNYLILNNFENAKNSLTRAFSYDAPRNKTCCELGQIFKKQKEYETAIFWFTTALHAQNSTSGWIEEKYSALVPYIELCVCYFFLGKKEKAKQYHLLAKSINPTEPAVLYNNQFFE